MWIIACSGPNAFVEIGKNIYLGYAHASAVAVLCLVSLLLAMWRKRWAPPAIIFVLLLLHPAWTISASRGDCGSIRVNAAWFVTVSSIGLVFFQTVLLGKRVHSKD